MPGVCLNLPSLHEVVLASAVTLDPGAQLPGGRVGFRSMEALPRSVWRGVRLNDAVTKSNSQSTTLYIVLLKRIDLPYYLML